MRNFAIIILIILGISSVSAQDTTKTSRTVKVSDIVPAAGDWAIGADATPYLNYVGNLFNGTAGNTFNPLIRNTFYGRYFVTSDACIRLTFSINKGSAVNRQYIADDAARMLDPLSQAKVEDMMTTLTNNASILLGYQKFRGYGKLRGFFGGTIGYSAARTVREFSYGNKITAANSLPTSYDFSVSNRFEDNGDNQNARLTYRDNGKSQTLLGGAVVGAEYYFLPKICIGGELFIGLCHSWQSQANRKYEKWNGTKVQTIDWQVTPASRTNTYFATLGYTDVLTYAGGLYLMFHF